MDYFTPQWKDISTAPEGCAIAIIVQYADESDQRIIPRCVFRSDLGGSYAEVGHPNDVIHLSDQGEFATHWAIPIWMPPVHSLRNTAMEP